MLRCTTPLFIAMSALVLQGCVAAVIPLAAGAVMANSARGASKTAQVEDTPTAPDNSPQRATDSMEARAKERAASIVPTKGAAPSATASASSLEKASQELGAFVILEGVTALPAPDPARDATYGAFAQYALKVAAQDPLTDDIRQSALLARPGTLTPDRAPCRFLGNAVMIDLDPASGEFEPAQPVLRPALSVALQTLRDNNVEVVWSTALTADRAGDVRSWLKQSDLDPAGRDRLLLLRYPEDRKQTRREEASRERCLVAMLGDERSDFDELFDYLKRPDGALALDAIIGKGWFLAPVAEGPLP